MWFLISKPETLNQARFSELGVSVDAAEKDIAQGSNGFGGHGWLLRQRLEVILSENLVQAVQDLCQLLRRSLAKTISDIIPRTCSLPCAARRDRPLDRGQLPPVGAWRSTSSRVRLYPLRSERWNDAA